MQSELTHTERLLREIQRDLADMRDDRTVMSAILERHDAALTSISAEQRALRSQLDRFRTEMREALKLLHVENTGTLAAMISEIMNQVFDERGMGKRRRHPDDV